MRSVVADPVVLVLLLLLGGAWLTTFRRRLGNALLIFGVVMLYLLANPFVSARLLWLAQSPLAQSPLAEGPLAEGPLAESPVNGSPAAQPPQAIVILSAGIHRGTPEYEGDTVDALTLERIRYGARLQRRTGLPILVTGGLVRHAMHPLAELMRQALVEDFGASARWVESRALNTFENAEQSAAMLRAEGINTIYLVTHAAHMVRSQEAFERAGLAVVPAATVFTSIKPAVSLRDLVPRTAALARSAYALHELVGRLWYRVAYGLSTLSALQPQGHSFAWSSAPAPPDGHPFPACSSKVPDPQTPQSGTCSATPGRVHRSRRP